MLIRLATLKTNDKPRLIHVIRFVSGFWFFLASLTFAISSETKPYRLVALGDSLTAGYGLARAHSFSIKLQQALQNNGYNVTVDNAGVSGDTTTGGLARLDWSIGENVNGVIIELGANDALRAISPKVTQAALEQILIRLKKRNIDLLLTGMLAPPNLGSAYGKTFNAIFPDLAEKYDLVYYPFFLKDVAGISSLNQADGLHPTAEGVGVIVKNILPKVKELLQKSSFYR